MPEYSPLVHGPTYAIIKRREWEKMNPTTRGAFAEMVRCALESQKELCQKRLKKALQR